MKYFLVFTLIIAVNFDLLAKPRVKQPDMIMDVKLVTKLPKATIPAEINYQGWLGYSSDTMAMTGVINMTFGIYDSLNNGTLLWSETQNNITVDKGIFNVLLGSVTPIPVSIFTGVPLWVETQINDEILSPRKKLVSVAYAIKAENANHAFYADTSYYTSGISEASLRKDIPDSTSNKIAYKFKFSPNSTYNGGTGLWCLLDTITAGSKTWQAICGQVYAKDINDINEFQATQGCVICLGQNGVGNWGQTIKYMGHEGLVKTEGANPIHNVSLRGLQGWAEALDGNVGTNVSCEGVYSITFNRSLYGSSCNFYGTQSTDGNGSRMGLYLDLGSGGAGSGFKSAGEIAGVKVYAYNDTTNLSNNVFGGWFSAGTSSSTGLPYTNGIYATVNRADGSKNYAGYFDGNVNIKGNLNVDNKLILSAGEIALQNGENTDVDLPDKVYFRIVGPTADFSIAGFSGIIANRMIIVYNTTNYNMTIKNNSGNSTNSIYTSTGSDMTTIGQGSVTLIYDNISLRWIVTSWQE